MGVEELTQDVVRKMFDYDPKTGELIRKDIHNKKTTTKLNGKVKVSIRNISTRVPKLVWLWVYGEYPNGSIEFKDGDSSNLRLDNLKKVPIKLKINENYIRHQVEKEGHYLLGYNYVPERKNPGQRHLMVVELKDGTIYHTDWKSWKSGNRKPRQKIDEQRVKEVMSQRPDFELIKFEKVEPNQETYLTVRHECGHEYRVIFYDFRMGSGCKMCTMIGENNHSWKGGVKQYEWNHYETIAERLAPYHKVYKVVIDEIPFTAVECFKCGELFLPKKAMTYARLRHIEEGDDYPPSEFYCSSACKKACKGFGRSDKQVTKQCRIDAGLEEENSSYRRHQKEWADAVKERAGWQCEKCGVTQAELEKKGETLIAHHIDPVINNPIESLDLDNGIALCPEHNKEVHKIPGCAPHELKCD